MNDIKFTVEIISNRKETPGIHLIQLKKPEGYVYIPGQYIKTSIQNSKYFSYFAIASHPDEKHIELLINSAGVNAGKICALPVGSFLNISSAIGPGFPVSKLMGKTIYLVTHGSGMSAIKPVIEELRKNRNRFDQIRLIYGVRTPDDFSFKNLIRTWMGSIEVYDIVSKDPGDMRIWSGEIGHVQDILHKIQPKPENAVVAVAGSEAMENEVSEIFKSFGFDDSQILRNH